MSILVENTSILENYQIGIYVLFENNTKYLIGNKGWNKFSIFSPDELNQCLYEKETNLNQSFSMLIDDDFIIIDFLISREVIRVPVKSNIIEMGIFGRSWFDLIDLRATIEIK